MFAVGDKLRLTSDVETIGVLAGGIANRNASLPTLNRLLYLDVLPSLNNSFPLLSPRLSFSSDNLNRGFFRCCCTQHDDTGWSNIRKRRDNNRVENNKYQCFPVNVIYLMWRVYVTRRCNPSCVLIAESDSAIRKVKQVRAVSVYIHVYTYIKRRPSIRSIKINENSSTLSQRGKNDRRIIIVRSCLFENFIKAINIYIYIEFTKCRNFIKSQIELTLTYLLYVAKKLPIFLFLLLNLVERYRQKSKNRIEPLWNWILCVFFRHIVSFTFHPRHTWTDV